MGHIVSNSLSVTLFRRVLHLANELHALPAHGSQRRRAMLLGLCDLTNADAAESALIRPADDGPEAVGRPVTVTRDGSRRPLRSLLFGSPLRGARRGPVDPALLALLGLVSSDGNGRVGTPAVVTRTRRQLVGERDWQLSPFVGLVRQISGYDDAVYSALPVGQPRDRTVAVVCLARRHGARRPMGAPEARITHLFHSEAAWVYASPAAAAPTHADSLTPRQHECLQQLLRGHGEKQIATDLRLSRHTVHVHIKAIYRHLGVSSRAELLTRYLPRNG